MATSDEPADETNLGTLNAALQAWRGKTLTVFDVARLLGDAFGVRDAMRELLDACGSVALPTETPDRNRESMPEGRTATAAATTAAAATDARATPAENDDDASASDGEGWPDSDDDDEYGSDAHGNDADDGNDSDGALPEDNELNSDQLTRLYQNKRKCVEREERRVQQKSLASEETRGEMTWDMKQAARAQIFTDKGAFARLSSELFALQERLDPALHVDAVEYDVYEWDVQARFVTTRTGPHTIPLARRAPFLEDGLYDSSLRPGFLAFNHPDTSRRLSTPLLTPFDSAHPAVCRHARTLDPQFKCRGFSPGSGMRQDLELLDAVNGYSHVHLKLHFKADLYPFYPPRVSLVRPKLSGVVPGAVIAHPRLRLRNWQPFRPISSVIEHLRTFLERFARVDLASEMNDDRRFPGGAYDDDQSKLELALARLASCGGGGGGGSEDLLPPKFAALYAREDAMDAEAGGASGGGSGNGGATETVPDFAAVLSGGDKARAEKERADAAAKVGGGGGGSAGKEKAANAKSSTLWAKGTGFGFDKRESASTGSGGDGGGGQQHWDAHAAKTAQAAEDLAVQTLLVEATSLIRAMNGGGGWDAAAVAAAAPASSSKRTPSKSKKGGKGKAAAACANATPPAAAPASTTTSKARADAIEGAVRQSSLAAFLARELRGCAFMDVVARASYYAALMHATTALAESPCADVLPRTRGLSETFEDVTKQARMFLRTVEGAEGSAAKTETADETAATGAAKTKSKAPAAGARGGKKPAVVAAAATKKTATDAEAAEMGDAEIARLILKTGAAVAAAVETARTLETTPARKTGAGPGAGPGASAPTSSSAAAKGGGKRKTRGGGGGGGDPEACAGHGGGAAAAKTDDASADAAAEARYRDALRPHVFDASPIAGSAHAYDAEARADLKNGPHISRVARELAGLASTLPLSRSSSALVRVDERRAVQWTILITGPEDTPYDCGAFLFDAFFPSSYPTSAPLVKFRTTGGGRVRFNPNLYKDGKVCLSLLGTWSGAKGETWDAASSTMLQVIVSIQSLILCAQPYFNEPGYERTIGTPEGDRQSSQYNAAIREHALRCAMIDQLKKPPAPFAEAIRAHFRERKERLLGPVRKEWCEGATGERKARLDKLFDELKAELEKL